MKGSKQRPLHRLLDGLGGDRDRAERGATERPDLVGGEDAGGGRSPSPWLALVVVVAGAVAGAAALALLLVDTDVDVSANTTVNPPGLVNANNSPTSATNPTDPDNVVVASRRDAPEYAAALHWTKDGGSTWETTDLPLPRGRDRPFAPDVAFAPDGTLYVTYVNLTGSGNTPQTLWLSRSDDGGQTLDDPERIAGELSFQARLTVGPDGTIHVVWLQAEEVALLSLPEPTPVVAARSTDGGQSFSRPVQVSDADRERVGAATPVVDAQGRLVVLYVDYGNNRRDFLNLEGPASEEPATLVVTTSDDGGRSFNDGVEIDGNLALSERFLVFLPQFPSLAAGPDGQLYVAWHDARNGDDDVFVRRSGDGGATWTEPVRVNDNRLGDGTDQRLPRLAVAPNGRVDVLFLDRRHDPDNVMTDAYYAFSTDRGAGFHNVRVTAESFDSRIGTSAASHLPPDLGSRIGLSSGNDAALGVWTDTRLGTRDTQRQDIVASRIDLPNLTLVAWLRRGLIAATAVGVIALLAWAWRSRTSRTRPLSQDQQDEQPAQA